MAKKDKKKLRLLLQKRQRLAVISAGNPAPANLTSPESLPELPTTKTKLTEQTETIAVEPSQLAEIGPALRRNTISIVIIGLIFFLALVVRAQTQLFEDFGDWLYQFLRLSR